MDPDEKLYGKLLYEESDRIFNARLKEGAIGAIFFISLGIFGLILGLFVWCDSFAEEGVFISGVGWVFIFFGYIFYIKSKELSKFNIFESGIKFAGDEFIKFSEIDHITILDHNFPEKKYFLIVMKDENSNMKRIYESQFLGDYKLIQKIIKKQLIIANKKIPEDWLIQVR